MQYPFQTKSFTMSAKKRKYLDEYIPFGFVCLQKGDTEVPQMIFKHLVENVRGGGGAWRQGPTTTGGVVVKRLRTTGLF